MENSPLVFGVFKHWKMRGEIVLQTEGGGMVTPWPPPVFIPWLFRSPSRVIPLIMPSSITLTLQHKEDLGSKVKCLGKSGSNNGQPTCRHNSTSGRIKGLYVASIIKNIFKTNHKPPLLKGSWEVKYETSYDMITSPSLLKHTRKGQRPRQLLSVLDRNCPTHSKSTHQRVLSAIS